MLRRLFPRVLRSRAPILPVAARLGVRPTWRSYHPSAPPDATVSQRLKHLVRSYGWYALGVYIVFSALDFTVAFAGIKLLGAEQVSQGAAYVKQLLSGLYHGKTPEPGRDEVEHPSTGSHEGLYAMLVLAYTIHKTLFLPIRVGLTAAFTPRIVGWLRARGWAGVDGAKRAAKEGRERIRITKGDGPLTLKMTWVHRHPWLNPPNMKRRLSAHDDDPSRRRKRVRYNGLEHTMAHMTLGGDVSRTQANQVLTGEDMEVEPALMDVPSPHPSRMEEEIDVKEVQISSLVLECLQQQRKCPLLPLPCQTSQALVLYRAPTWTASAHTTPADTVVHEDGMQVE